MIDDLPPGWAMTTLGEVFEIVGGATPRTDEPSFWGGDIPWVTPDDLARHEGIEVWGGRRTITSAGFASTSTHLLPKGSVLFSSRAPIGYVAVAARPLCTNQGFKSLIPPVGVDARYVYWYLRHATPAIRDMGSGTTFKEMSKKRMAAVPFVQAPNSEQRRIVAAIEEHFSRVDALDRALAVADDRLHAMHRSVALHSFDRPDWDWTTLGEIAELKGDITKDSKREADPEFEEFPYLRVANVQRGYLDLTDVTTIRADRCKAQRLVLCRGDILFNEGGDRDKLGRGWVWEGQIEDCIHQNHVFRARLLEDRFDPYFVSLHANSWGQQWFETHGKQTTNLASLNLTTLKSFPVPAPSLSEQRIVASHLRSALDSVQHQRLELERLAARAGSLRRSILAEAFAGRLVV